LEINVGGIKSNSKEMHIRCGPGNPKAFVDKLVKTTQRNYWHMSKDRISAAADAIQLFS